MLTLRGSVFLGGALLLIAAGILRIDGPLITLGALGMIILAMAWVIGARNLAAVKVLPHLPARLFANQPFDLRLTVKNERRFLDGFQLSVDIDLPGSSKTKGYLRWIAGGTTATMKLRASVPLRGNYREHRCTLCSAFPLGLLRQKKIITVQREVLVFPQAITPSEFFKAGAFDDAWLGEGLQAGDAPGEPRGIRPFRPGDPAKHLHWPSTIRSLARGRSPRVRESDPPGERPARVTVIFHSYATDGTLIRTDDYERALSLLCGTLRHLRKIGVPAVLRADFLEWLDHPAFQVHDWSGLLGKLAYAQRAKETEAHDLQAIAQECPDDEAIIVISDMVSASWRDLLPQRNLLIIETQAHAYEKRALKFRDMG